jgi:Rrf2 family protein
MRPLSQRTRYALSALQHLARAKDRGDGPILISRLSEEENLPQKFLEAILLELKNKGILQSKKGRGGGYALLRPPDLITLGEVIRLFDGPLAPLPCVSETAYRKCDECEDEKTCGTRSVMKEVRDAMARIVDQTTLAELLARSASLSRDAEKGGSYSI